MQVDFLRGEISLGKLVSYWRCLFATSLSIGDLRCELIYSWQLSTCVAIFEKEIGEVCWCSSLNNGFYGSSNGFNQKISYFNFDYSICHQHVH
jgi:hypothetical protein